MRLTSRSITILASAVAVFGGLTSPAFAKPKPGAHPDLPSNCYGSEFTICDLGDNCGDEDLYYECQALLNCGPLVAGARCNWVDMGAGDCYSNYNQVYFNEFQSDHHDGADQPPWLICDF